MASQLGASLFPPHAPSVYDFRERDHRLFAYLSDGVNGTSVYEMYPIGFRLPQGHGAHRTLIQKDNNLITDEKQQLLGEMERALIEDNPEPRPADSLWPG
jgi:hypothetical protein